MAGCIAGVVYLFGYEEGLFYCGVFYACCISLFFVINALYYIMSIRLIKCNKTWLLWVMWGMVMAIVYSILWFVLF